MRLHIGADSAAGERRVVNGERVAAVLEASWRPAPDPLAILPETLSAVAPFLLGTGCAGLAWWRLKGSPLADRHGTREIRQAYRLHVLQATLHQRAVVRAFAALRDAGVEPILGKGWAAARLYPDPGLRPYGDVDLYVPRDQAAAARRALAAPEAQDIPADLHVGFAELDDHRAEDLYARSRLRTIGGAEVRIFGTADHLRLLALHLLRHGAWRPLWLCDLAAAVEAPERDLDWSIVLSGNPRRSQWTASALVLCRELLGARLDGAPAAVEEQPLPRWLVPTALRQWGSAGFEPHGARTPMAAQVARPRLWLRALRKRWPNGIEATVGVRGPFNAWPRLPFQVAECVRRSALFARTFVDSPWPAG